MKPRDLLKLSTGALRAHRSRSFLTTLGIIIGVGAVIIVMSVGAGAQSLITNQIKGIGSNLIAVFPGASKENGPPASVLGVSITTLTYEDARALQDKGQAPHVVAVSPMVRGVGTVSWRNRSVDTNFVGVSSEYIEVEEADAVLGRFFDANSDKVIDRVAVLGSQVKENLFGGENALGESIKIKKERFTVIGVMAPRGTVGFSNQDDQIFIPVMSAQKLLLGINHVTLLRAKVDAVENIDESMADMKVILRDRHNIPDPSGDDFTVSSQQQALDSLLSITNAVRFFLAAIAAIALLVGGIGIMNIMFVSVTERTREIGLRKAIGADSGDILWQFLIEAVALTLLGGIIGIILGIGFSSLVALVARFLNYDWDLVISGVAIFLGCAVSVVIGLGFGIYPARKAARLDPIEALRYE